jgi:HSP20 family protein
MTLVKFNHQTPKFINGWVENILNDFTSPIEKRLTDNNSFTPSVNIKETADAYVLELLAPGRTKEDIKINIEKNLLTISYEKKSEQKSKDEQTNDTFIRREFNLQPFKRSFTLDNKIDSDNITAKYENGLLSLNLPKRPEAKVVSKEIEVQ